MRLVQTLATTTVTLAALVGCRGEDAPAESARVPPLVTVGPENIAVAEVADLRSGPPISGSLEAEQSATVRAEVGGTVLKTYADEGERVSRGAVLARIEDVALRDAALSARSAVRSAQASLELAKRNLERTERLSQAGAVADRDLESARVTATNAEGALADAQARLASAGQQLGHATVRAPFSGIVSERQVDEGDVVQLGAALFSVVDPAELRLEANVPGDQAGQLKPGTPVEFRVAGFDRPFTGKISRVNPVVDPNTRQVRIYAAIPNRDRTLVAGLFAQGRVATRSARGVAAPVAAVDQRGSTPVVHRLQAGKVTETPVKLGIRDDAAEMIEIANGVSAGDTLLLGSAQGISAGSRVRVLEEDADR